MSAQHESAFSYFPRSTPRVTNSILQAEGAPSQGKGPEAASKGERGLGWAWSSLKTVCGPGGFEQCSDMTDSCNRVSRGLPWEETIESRRPEIKCMVIAVPWTYK